MAPRRKPKPSEETPEPSMIYLHGYYRLAAGILAQSFIDLRRTVEVERALDSFCWLLFGDGLVMLNAIGFEQFDETDLIRAIGRI